MANGGTIFLDEIGDLDMSCQVKLLRVLQDQTFEVLGDSKPRKADVRVVSATNRNLWDMVTEHTFREDLFYRINLISIHLPALRERAEDIPLLAKFFACQYAERNNLPEFRFTSDALIYLQRLPYPGNIRELKNLVERTILVCRKPILDARDFEKQGGKALDVKQTQETKALKGMTLDELEKQSILSAIDKYDGNLSHVAMALGISRASLYRRLEKYDITLRK
jgi:two-component system NtrC family response regulator